MPGEKKLPKEAKTQIWALPLDGGEARPVSAAERAVRAFPVEASR